MKNLSLLAAGLVLLGVAAHASAAPNCTIKLQGNDQMQFDLKTATVSASCATIDIQLLHAGKLPVNFALALPPPPTMGVAAITRASPLGT